MTDETTIRLNMLIKKYGLYSMNLSVPKKVAIYGPPSFNGKVIYIEHSKLIRPDWNNIEKTLVEYTLLHSF